MTNSKSTKKALLTSALAVFMCVAMLVGTTFAWFTDSASTAVNKIQAGTLDIQLLDKEGNSLEGKTLEFTKAEDAPEGEAVLWEPGCTYNLPVIQVKNGGNLALKFKIAITGINGDAKLNEAIEWTIDGLDTSTEYHLLPGATSDLLTISGHMKEEAGNEYQGLSIDGVAITVYATQDTVEYDSEDNQYDANAEYDIPWDGTASDVPAEDAEDGKIHITNANELAALMEATSQGGTNSLYIGKTFVLDSNIDFGGKTISGIGSHNDNIVFTFDGNGHTISNFTINGIDENHKEIDPTTGETEYRYAGLFQQFNGTVKNLTVRNATVIGNQMVGVIASNIDNGGKLENCSVYNSTVIGAKKVGAVAGYIAGTGCSMTGCYAENCNVFASDSGEAQSAELLGYTGAGATVSNEEPVNVNVYRGTTPTFVSSAAELAALNTKTGLTAIVITNDIDMSAYPTRKALKGGTEGTVFSSNGVTIVGNGHTISGLTSALVGATTYPVTINDLTIADSTIADNDSYSGVGAFVSYSDISTITLNNCHVVNTTIDTTRDTRVATLVGWSSGVINITDCSVENCNLSAHGSIGAAIGHSSGATTIENITVKNCEFKSIDEGSWRVGVIIGTADTASFTINGYTNTNNSLLQTGKTAPAGENLYGRTVNGGTVTIA